MKVTRLYKTLPVTPGDVAEGKGWRGVLTCSACGDERPLPTERLRRWWSEDMADVMGKVGFRCRCGGYADTLQVIRSTPDHVDFLLTVHRPRPGAAQPEPPVAQRWPKPRDH